MFPVLVSALIDSPPNFYGDLTSYAPFIARMILKTMSLVWLDLINSHNYPFYLWDDRNKEMIIQDWCRKTGLIKRYHETV